eukprot:scaffold13058_cov72-Phaeocystis_antarctica.AAC.3
MSAFSLRRPPSGWPSGSALRAARPARAAGMRASQSEGVGDGRVREFKIEETRNPTTHMRTSHMASKTHFKTLPNKQAPKTLRPSVYQALKPLLLLHEEGRQLVELDELPRYRWPSLIATQHVEPSAELFDLRAQRAHQARLQLVESLLHGGLRHGTGGGGLQDDSLERRQRASVERSGEGCAAGVGDLGAAEVELLERRQPSSRWLRRTCRRRRRHEGGEALVAEWIEAKSETYQRGPPPQGRREGHQARVTDGGVVQSEVLEPRQGASAQRGGKRRGACVAHMRMAKNQVSHGRQRARAQPLRQPLHAVGTAEWGAVDEVATDEVATDEVQLLEHWQHRAQRAQRRQVRVVFGVDCNAPVDLLRLAQLLAAPHPHSVAQRRDSLVLSPQLLPQRLRQLPQLMTGAAEVHGETWLERFAQLAEDVLTDLVGQVLKQRDAGVQLRRRQLAEDAGLISHHGLSLRAFEVPLHIILVFVPSQLRRRQQCGERVHRHAARVLVSSRVDPRAQT